GWRPAPRWRLRKNGTCRLFFDGKGINEKRGGKCGERTKTSIVKQADRAGDHHSCVRGRRPWSAPCFWHEIRLGALRSHGPAAVSGRERKTGAWDRGVAPTQPHDRFRGARSSIDKGIRRDYYRPSAHLADGANGGLRADSF